MKYLADFLDRVLNVIIPAALVTMGLYYVTHGHQGLVWFLWIFVGLVLGFDKIERK